MMTSTALLTRDALADELRLERGALAVVDPRLDLLKRGVIVSITAKHWTPSARLTDEDLGLERGTPAGAEEEEDPVILGHKLLLPRQLAGQLSSVTRGLRSSAYEAGFKTGWGWFVPSGAWNSFVVAYKSREEEFFAFRNLLCGTYTAWTEDVVRTYRLVSWDSYERARLGRARFVENVSRDDYIERYITAVRNLIPAVETLRDSFSASLTLSMIPLKDYLEASLPEIVENNAQAQMERAVLEQAREKKAEYVDGFFKDVTMQLRSYVYDTVAAALEAVQKNNTVSGPSVRSLKTLVDRVRTLNFTNDAELEAGIGQIESLLALPAKQRNADEVSESLKCLAVVTRASLLDLGEQPRTLRHVEVDDMPTPAALSRARRSLGVETTIEAAPLARAARTLGETYAL